MSTRSAEYRLLMEEILAEDAALREQGLPGLDELEIKELRYMIVAAERNMLAKMIEEKK